MEIADLELLSNELSGSVGLGDGEVVFHEQIEGFRGLEDDEVAVQAGYEGNEEDGGEEVEKKHGVNGCKCEAPYDEEWYLRGIWIWNEKKKEKDKQIVDF